MSTIQICNIEGSHLTAGNKKAIQAILSGGLTSGKVGRTEYHITQAAGMHTVAIYSMNRGLGFIGEPLRWSCSAKATFTLKTI